MKTLISLEYELKNWSWGLVAQHLVKELEQQAGYKVIRLETGRKQLTPSMSVLRKIMDPKTMMILSQNVSQLPKIEHLKNTLSRLGGNMTFADLNNPTTKHYLELMSQCAAVIVTNHHLLRIANKVHKSAYLIPNGLDLSEWSRIKSGKPTGSMRVGFCGNISSASKRAYKGYPIVEKACKALGLPLVKALYGEGQIPHAAMREKFWKQIDVLVLLTDGEGCSNTIMEATACGIPVITTREAGLHGELMEHGRECLFSVKDVDELIHNLQLLQSFDGLYETISDNSRAFAEKHHDIHKVGEAYLKVLRKHSPK